MASSFREIRWSGRDSQLPFLLNSDPTRPGWVPQSSKLQPTKGFACISCTTHRGAPRVSDLPRAVCRRNTKRSSASSSDLDIFKVLVTHFHRHGELFPPSSHRKSDEQSWPFLFTALSSPFVNKQKTFDQVSEHGACATHEHNYA